MVDPCTPLLLRLATDQRRLPIALASFALVERVGGQWLNEIPAPFVTAEIAQQQQDELRHAGLLDSLAATLADQPVAHDATRRYLQGLRRHLDRVCLTRRRALGGEVSAHSLYLARYSILGLLFERRAYRIYSCLCRASADVRVRELMTLLVREEREHYRFAAANMKWALAELGVTRRELFSNEGTHAQWWLTAMTESP